MDASELAEAHADEFLDGILFVPPPLMGSVCSSAAASEPSSGGFGLSRGSTANDPVATGP